MKNEALEFSRRRFLGGMASASAAGAVAPWLLNFAAMGAASAAPPSDYKALVCVFLYGGNDQANTLVPYDPASYASYQTLRPGVAYPYAELTNTRLDPLQVPVDRNGASRQYALAPELAPLLPIFGAGRLAVLLNVGTLIQPTTKQQYLSKSVALPSKLFSHNDQQSEWQSSGSEGTTTGWGGRMEDRLLTGNAANDVFSCINVFGNAVFVSGLAATQLQVTAQGAVALAASGTLFGSAAAATALKTVITRPSAQWLEDDHATIAASALAANETLNNALASAPAISTVFPTNNVLADQLKMVARIASVAPALGVRRQVFFVALGGFDNHDTLATSHPQLLTQTAGALSSFYDATNELGLASAITAFTASDFGRTLTVNNDGSDHGWGSMHLIVGGAVNGQRYYGTPPVVAADGPDDVGQGRLLPTVSVDQYAATLGRWFGLGDADLLAVLPNLANYPADARYLGFV